MPATIRGLDEALKALRKIDPELSRQLKKGMRPTLRLMQDEARAYVQYEIVGLRTGWMNGNPDAKSRTSRKRAFPMYDPTAARKGIVYSLGAKKNTRNGWTALFSLINKTASGAIIETAGRKNRSGDPRSQSNNPNAGAHFIQSIENATGAIYRTGSSPKSQGRLIFRSVANNRAQFRATVIEAVNDTYRKVAA